MKNTAEEIRNNLAHYINGTDEYTRHIGSLVMTDGVRYLAESCGAFWLLDIVFSYQTHRKVSGQYMQVYKLTLNDKGGALMTIEDGNNNVLVTQKIPYTDFPLTEGITIWAMESGKHRVMMLPSEY
jgi:hypothetical protein